MLVDDSDRDELTQGLVTPLTGGSRECDDVQGRCRGKNHKSETLYETCVMYNDDCNS